MTEYKKEDWRVKPPMADVHALAEQFSISPILAHIIVNREITEAEAVERYLSDDLSYVYDPALMKDMDKGCRIMSDKIRNGKKIRIISDYDVDGITSNYILYQGLRKAGADISYDIPHRILDGYGMNVRLVDAAYADGVDTIITCDNGIAAEAAVNRAKELGMTVIVTDHHEVPCVVGTIPVCKSGCDYRSTPAGMRISVQRFVRSGSGIQIHPAFISCDGASVGRCG